MSVKKCPICGKFLPADGVDIVKDVAGNQYHRDCVENSDDYFICDNCGYVESMENHFTVYDNGNELSWCEECVDADAVECAECERLVPSNNACYYEHLGNYYCDECFEDMTDSGRVIRCDDCDEYFWEDDVYYNEDGDAYYCDYCNDRHCSCYKPADIRDYHCNPDIVFFPKPAAGERFKGFGIELEVSADGRSPDCGPAELASYVYTKLGSHAYFMHDGSIGRGVEIITQPHTMEEFLKLPWAETLDLIRSHDYRSHDTGNCGLHMHISRAAMTEDGVARIIYFYEHYIQDILRISRRTNSQMSEWACTYGWGSLSFKELADKIGYYNHGEHCDRYHAVNLTNDNTIEFRLMRGTLNKDSFFATIDFLWTTAMNACSMTNDDIDNPANFLKGLKPDTIEYIKRRNAFVGVI